MIRYKFKYFFVFILFSFGILQSQEDYVVNTSKFLQKINPSYFGFNSLMNVGVLYNSMNINAYDKMDNKYVFGSMKDKSIYFFELSDQKKLNNLVRVEVFERIRDLKFKNNQLFLFLENTASIGVINLD